MEHSYVVPGTQLIAGAYPGVPPSAGSAAGRKKLEAFLDAGITAFIDLTRDTDPLAPYAPALRQLAEEREL